MTLTETEAARILTAHGFAWRPSATLGAIDGLMPWTHVDPVTGARSSGETWEAVACTVRALRDWLGY